VRFSRPLVLLSTTWAALAGGCSTRSSDAATAAASTQMPITTASPDARALYIKGRGLAELLRTHDAHEVLQQAAAKDSTFAMAQYNLALTAPTAKEFFEHLNRAVALANQVSDGERLTILSLQSAANADPIKAQAYADSVVTRFPRDERARFVHGNTYAAQQQNELAAGEYEQAVAINPDFSPAYNSLGYAYRAMGRKTDAEPVFKKYIELVPNDPNPHDSYAELLMSMGRFDESIVEYGKALAIDPHFTSSYVGIAANQLFKGRSDAAIAETEKLYDSARDQNDRRVALFNEALAYVD
jgi:tetratricopeptide (TPR) repeat protein